MHHFLLLNVFQRIWDFVLYSSKVKKAHALTITIGDIFFFIFWVILLYIAILVILKKLLRKAFRKFTSGQVDHIAMANITSLILFIIAFLILLSFHGIDLTALSVFGGLLRITQKWHSPRRISGSKINGWKTFLNRGIIQSNKTPA